jgi:hypothetical protein
MASSRTRWTIHGEPEEAPWEGTGSRAWSWQIQRDFELRRLLVEVTAHAEAAADREVRRVLKTFGRSAVESVLAEGDPPHRIIFTTAGRIEWPFRAAAHAGI